MNCKHCGKPLNEAQYKGDMKSCPNCSKHNPNGYHVYHKNTDDFGTTDKRITSKNTDGVQSYCAKCRGNQGPCSGTECDKLP